MDIIKNIKVIKFLFYIFPFIMFMASGYITVYVTVLTILSLTFFYKNNIKIKILFIDYLLFAFFLISTISSFINIKILGNLIVFKSILDLRFVFFFLIIRNIVNYKLIIIEKLSILTLFCVLFLSFDVIFQNINGRNIFGYESIDGRFNGIFKDEAIAGSYLQKFYLISFLTILLSNINKINKYFIVTFFINIVGIGILLSLDRMPFLMYLFSLSILLLIRKYRLLLLTNLLIILSIFIIIFNSYEPVRFRYATLKNEFNLKKITQFINEKYSMKKVEITEYKNKNFHAGYLSIYKSAYYLWLEKPFIGSGVKSYAKLSCNNQILLENKNIICTSHPHNIYLEILVNQGLLGLLIFLFLIILILNKLIKKLFIKNNNIITIIFIAILITEIIPLRSYGSIFQTVNGSIFWFLIALSSVDKIDT